jgi:tetratricopeptide (TPR) repeat protein
MTTKELAALGKRLLPQLVGFTVRGQLLFISPVGDILRGIFFDRSGNPRSFYVQVMVQPLYIPAEHIVFSFGWRLGGRSWSADDPDLFPKLSHAIQSEAVPFLSKIRSASDVPNAAQSLQRFGDPNIRRAVAYSLARADEREKAIEALEQFLQQMPPYPWTEWLEKDAKRAELLRARLLKDSAEAQKQLEAWKNETRKNLGWEGVG